MKDNTYIVLAAMCGLIILGVVGMLTSNAPLAYTAVGAAAGVVAGHLNGSHTDSQPCKDRNKPSPPSPP